MFRERGFDSQCGHLNFSFYLILPASLWSCGRCVRFWTKRTTIIHARNLIRTLDPNSILLSEHLIICTVALMFCGSINMPNPLKHTAEPWSLQSRTDNHKSDDRDVIVTASNW